MDLETLTRLRPALERYLADFDGCIKTRPSRQHLRTYVGGQLGPLARKNIEAIALDAQVPVRTLQEFLSLHRWDHEAVGRQVRARIRDRHSAPGAVGVIDETSFAKCGPKTVGVKRQYCGASGKIDNCVVTVHLGYAAGGFHSLLDGDLFLPEDWADDRSRCEAAGVPAEVEYRPKWRIALELIERSLAEGLELEWITADELYGRAGGFRDAVERFGLNYVVEVPCDTKGWTSQPALEPAGVKPPTGRPWAHEHLAAGAPRSRRVDKLWKRGGPSWELYRVKDTDKGPAIWRVRETRFHPWRKGLPGAAVRLLIAENVLEEETKYFLANAPDSTPTKELLRVAFSRWQIERLFREGKCLVGLDEFQVRSYLSLMRHLVLSTLSLLFLAEETEKLRGEKSEVDDLPGTRSDRCAAEFDTDAGGEAATTGAGCGQDRVPAAPRR